jgi:chorismate mutase
MADDDPRIAELREELTENDVRIVEAVNARLELVARLKGVKDELGIDFLDPAREQWLLEHLAERNGGPLSADGGARALHDPARPDQARARAHRRELAVVRVGRELVRRDGIEKRPDSSGSSSARGGTPAAAAISSSEASPSNSTPDSSITSSATKILAPARTASAIASEGRESISISDPFCWIVIRA